MGLVRSCMTLYNNICEPSNLWITNLLDLSSLLSLSSSLMQTQGLSGKGIARVTPYQDLLEFLNLHAQASEASTSEHSKKSSRGDKSYPLTRPVASYTSNVMDPVSNCVVCTLCMHAQSLSHSRVIKWSQH